MVLVWGRPLELDRSARVERVNDPPESSECPVPESKHFSCPCPEKVEVFSAARIRVNATPNIRCEGPLDGISMNLNNILATSEDMSRAARLETLSPLETNLMNIRLGTIEKSGELTLLEISMKPFSGVLSE
ncbi:hypothetical protein TNCV_1494531 [Trichonephila clavipes]|nr:hypothetical protein TNCV_1494531 [Trichonephila clavipes]